MSILKSRSKRIPHQVGYAVKEFRRGACLNQLEVSSRMGLSQGQYSKFESGKSVLNIVQLFELSVILRRDIADFFEAAREA